MATRFHAIHDALVAAIEGVTPDADAWAEAARTFHHVETLFEPGHEQFTRADRAFCIRFESGAGFAAWDGSATARLALTPTLLVGYAGVAASSLAALTKKIAADAERLCWLLNRTATAAALGVEKLEVRRVSFDRAPGDVAALLKIDLELLYDLEDPQP